MIWLIFQNKSSLGVLEIQHSPSSDRPDRGIGTCLLTVVAIN